jgi:farnesyl-diphosphate farnesyltransferase
MADTSLKKAWDFCFEALPKVSRTFALSISKLKEPLRKEVCVSYLICRILDTVEDAPLLNTEKRGEVIFPFLKNLEECTLTEKTLFRGHEELIKKGTSQSDLELLTGVDDVLSAYISLEEDARKAIFPWVKEMGEGMVLYSKKMDRGGIKTIKTMKELDEYCYYIAGTVGFLLTELFFLNSPNIDKKLADELKKNANDFGLGLQKVNILKDVRDDHKRGWCFVPSELLKESGLSVDDLCHEANSERVFQALLPLFNGLKNNLDKAFEYLLKMPAEEKETRLFLSTSLFFAGATMSFIAKKRKYFLSEKKLKISRLEVAAILLKLESKAGDNEKLAKLWKDIISPYEKILAKS